MSALPPRQVPRKRITRARPCCLRLEEGYGRDSSSVNKGAQRERGPPRELRAPVQASFLSVRRATLLRVVALLAACHRGGGHHETSPLRLGQPAKENPFAKGVFVCPGGYDWPAYGDVVYAPSDSVLEARVGRERSVEFLGCTGARNVQSVTVRGHAGEWIHCLGGETMNSAVSLHSDTVTNRAIAPAVAAGVEPVAPQDG